MKSLDQLINGVKTYTGDCLAIVKAAKMRIQSTSGTVLLMLQSLRLRENPVEKWIDITQFVSNVAALKR